MKKLLIINTGGTFSSVESERGLKPGLSSHELLDAMRLVAGGIELEMCFWWTAPISFRTTGAGWL